MFKKSINLKTVGVLMLFLAVNLIAGGGKRNGTSGAEELLIPVSARGTAMGGSYLAGLTGVGSVFYNPAGLAVANGGTEAMFSYMSYIADINYEYAGVGVNFESFGSLGFNVRNLDFGDIPETTVENPYGTGSTFSPRYVTIGVTYSNHLTDRIRVGVTFNFVTQQIERTSASGIAVDAGVQYDNLGGVEGLQFGLVLKNLGAGMKFAGSDLIRQATETTGNRGIENFTIDAATFELPSQLEMGLAYATKFADTYSMVLAASFQNNSFSNDEYHFGAEFGFNDLLYVRGGYVYVSEQSDNEDQNIFGPTFGAGIHINSGIDITVDYAYRWVRYFDANHMVTVKFGF